MISSWHRSDVLFWTDFLTYSQRNTAVPRVPGQLDVQVDVSDAGNAPDVRVHFSWVRAVHITAGRVCQNAARRK
jgi:hypothetical protein